MKRAASGFLAAIGLCLTLVSPAHSAPRASQVTAWDAFLADEGGQWSIRWRDDLGTPATMRNQSERAPSAAVPVPTLPEVASRLALDFLSARAAVLSARPGLDQFVARGTRQSEHGSFVRTQQLYRDVPVRGGGYTVTLRPDGTVHMLNGRFFSGIELDVVPRIPAGRAVAMARTALGRPAETSNPAPELTILPREDGSYALAWIVTLLPRGEFMHWRIAIDARSGEVIFRMEAGLNAHPAEAASSGPRNVVLTNGSVLPSNICNPSSSVMLQRLFYPDTILFGNFANVTQFAASGTPPRAKKLPDGTFNFTYPNPLTTYDEGVNAHFDEVNVYHHTDLWFQRYSVAPFNYTNAQITSRTQLKAYENYWPNAAFNPVIGEVGYGLGNFNTSTIDGTSGSYDPAKNRDIIYHELNHAMLFRRGIGVPDTTTWWNRENLGIHEGYSDYFVCSYSNDAGFGRCEMLDRQNGPQCKLQPMRRLDNDPAIFRRNNTLLQYTYCDGITRGYTNPHMLGMIWSGALWAIRGGMGVDPTTGVWRFDEIAFAAVDAMGSNPDFDDAFDALLDRDQWLYPDNAHPPFRGQHEYVIRTKFFERGIGPGCPAAASTPVVAASYDNQTICGVRLTWLDVANAEGFRIFRDGGEITTPIWAPAGPGTPMEFIDPLTDTGVHSYRIWAYNDCGIETGSNTVQGKRAPALAAPTGLTATSAACAVNLSWNAVTYATAYNVYRDGGFLKQVTTTSTPDSDAPLKSSNYTVASVKCTNPQIVGSQSAPVAGQPSTVLAAPTVTADDGVSETEIKIRWTAVAGAVGYHVYRLPSTLLCTWTGGALECTDTAPPNGSVSYAVAAYACTPPRDGPQGTDTGFKKLQVTIAGPTALSSGQTGTWTVTVAGGVPPYTYSWQRYRDCPGAPAPITADLGETALASIPDQTLELTCWLWWPTGTNSPSMSLSDNVDFRVKCTVTDAGGNTGFGQRNVDIPGVTGSPQPGVGTVTATDGDATVNKVKITWGPSDGAEGFRIYRAGTLIYTATQNMRSYVDPTAPAVISNYCVAAYSGPNSSAQSCNTGYPYVALVGTVSGPGQLNYGATGTYSISLSSGGIAPVTRQWYHATYCAGPIDPAPPSALESDRGGPELLAPPCNVNYPFGTGTTSVSWMGTYDVKISCRVTDAVGRSIQPYKIVDVLGAVPNALAGEREDASLLTEDLPDRTELMPVKNPVRGLTDVSFTLAEPLKVSLVVFDIAGRRVEQLAAGEMPRGRHRLAWDAGRHPAGMYVYRFTAGGVTSTRRFMLVR